jgi:hypothetical protein
MYIRDQHMFRMHKEKSGRAHDMTHWNENDEVLCANLCRSDYFSPPSVKLGTYRAYAFTEEVRKKCDPAQGGTLNNTLLKEAIKKTIPMFVKDTSQQDAFFESLSEEPFD